MVEDAEAEEARQLVQDWQTAPSPEEFEFADGKLGRSPKALVAEHDVALDRKGGQVNGAGVAGHPGGRS